jgi:hypothetical protein
MPFPANWLEELVVEWLDLDVFAISTSIDVPAPPGGRLGPDVVGAKLDMNGQRLFIRHCEAAMHLAGPEKVAARYSAKFGSRIEERVRSHFVEIFGDRVPEQMVYEKWVITFRPSARVQAALRRSMPGIQIWILRDFVLNEVLPAIKRYRRPPHKKRTQLPADKWLLHLIDWFMDCHLINAQADPPNRP